MNTNQNSDQNSDILVTKPYLPPLGEYIQELRELWDTAILSNQGVKYRQLQKELQQFLGVPQAELFANGHLALEAALSIFDLHGEIITTPFTFASTVQAILRCGCNPVFCDINDYDFTIDASKIEALITDKTTAILPVHVYGNICATDEIGALADKYKLKVIYDAAHAFGETYRSRSIAEFGDAVMFSFHATKSFHTVEGGCVVYKDSSLTERLQAFRQFGQVLGTDSFPYLGGNAKLSELHAAMGLCNLRHYAEFTERRKMICSIYARELGNKPGIKLSYNDPSIKRNYTYFPIVIEESGTGINREMVLASLQNHHIYARKYFSPLCSNFAIVKQLSSSGDTPMAKHVADRVLALPCYDSLTADQAQRICQIILDLYK
ncbi:MAG: DegT/DnrJ/EryC1/StrS family aminotransferase [bacterium]|nr:DegT/DnrJ/EryC1/StrS family aminotransferase [bacterium]